MSTNQSMDGKIVVITGGNSGIGKATACELANAGATVVIACRDAYKAHAAVEEITAATGSNKVEFIPLDLADLNSVKHFTQLFLAKYDQLHVLINNAGVIFLRKNMTENGIEAQFGINHLGHFLLTNLLLDTLKKSAPSRVINVSSAMHYIGRINFASVHGENGYGPTTAYGQSKLANILFTKELAERLKDSGVTAYCLHPGVVSTNLFGELPKPLRKISDLFLTSPQKACQTSVYLAQQSGIEALSGNYFAKKKPAGVAPQANDKETQKKLWEVSETLCKGFLAKPKTTKAKVEA